MQAKNVISKHSDKKKRQQPWVRAGYIATCKIGHNVLVILIKKMKNIDTMSFCIYITAICLFKVVK